MHSGKLYLQSYYENTSFVSLVATISIIFRYFYLDATSPFLVKVLGQFDHLYHHFTYPTCKKHEQLDKTLLSLDCT